VISVEENEMINEIVTKCGCRIFEDVIAYCDKHGGRMSYLWKQAAKKWRRSSIRNNDRYTVMLGRRAYARHPAAGAAGRV
jgi:hypothetical protein